MDHTSPNPTDFDVLIVGAGMVGLSLAAALGRTSMKIGMIEAHSLEAKATRDDGRASAIALGSAQIFDQIGAWKGMQTLGISPIYQIKVSDEGFDHEATLRREDLQVNALGYIVENRVTEAALIETLTNCSGTYWIRPAVVTDLQTRPDGVEVTVQQMGETHTYTAQLVVGADGRQSPIRQWAHLPLNDWDYDQVLIVCTITTEFDHQQTGYERFHSSGPFAILPMVPDVNQPGQHRCCIVWTARKEEQQVLMGLGDEDFMTALQPRLSADLGKVLSVSPRACYAPRRQHASHYVAPRIALIGDAAHATHPVGGQGLNMGMRDVAALASLLSEAHLQGKDLGDIGVLKSYQDHRRLDNETVLFGTDLANRLFSNTCWPLQGIRRLALVGLNQIPPIRQLLLQYAMGLAPGQMM
jgi:2-octaprenyl-6-methoxyphenol hydroxylase